MKTRPTSIKQPMIVDSWSLGNEHETVRDNSTSDIRGQNMSRFQLRKEQLPSYGTEGFMKTSSRKPLFRAAHRI